MNAAQNPDVDLLLARAYELTQQGLTPYAHQFSRTCTLVEINENFDEVEDTECILLEDPVQVCGRVSWLKYHGDHFIIRIADQHTHLQVIIRPANLPEPQARLLQNRVYRGDYLGFHVVAIRRVDGFVTAEVDGWCYLSLANLPIPLHIDIQRQRHERHLHLASSLEAREQMVKRSQVIHQIRRVLNNFDILEVSTPHPNPPDSCHLQHYLVGGLEQIYEIRSLNQYHAVDWLNHPQALCLRACIALKTLNYGMQLMEDLLLHLTRYLHAHTVIWNKPFELMNGSEHAGLEAVFPEDRLQQIDLSPGWAHRKVSELIETIAGIDFTQLKNVDEALAVAKEAGLQIKEGANHQSIDDVLLDTFRQLIQPILIQPTFVLYPIVDSDEVGSFELIIKGIHLGCGSIIRNDPTQMAKNMTMRTIEGKSVLMLGMPPAIELSLNIDRLCMLLLNIDDIRDVIPFPFPIT